MLVLPSAPEQRVGKLISSPSDYPRAYICDQCIAVCASILEDDREEEPARAERRVCCADIRCWIIRSLLN